jgi:hypothetical protein
MFTLRSYVDQRITWSHGNKFLEFLGHFIYHVKQTKNQVLLLLDNHESHITISAITKCQANAVIMLTFPPHTRHKQQPLHRCGSGPCKKFHNMASSNSMFDVWQPRETYFYLYFCSINWSGIPRSFHPN